MIDPTSPTPEITNVPSVDVVDQPSQPTVVSTTTTPTNSATPKKQLSPKLVVGLLALILTGLGGGAAFLLSETSQDIRQQAQQATYYTDQQCISDFYNGSAQTYGQQRQSCDTGNGVWDYTSCTCDFPNDDSNNGLKPVWKIKSSK